MKNSFARVVLHLFVPFLLMLTAVPAGQTALADNGYVDATGESEGWVDSESVVGFGDDVINWGSDLYDLAEELAEGLNSLEVDKWLELLGKGKKYLEPLKKIADKLKALEYIDIGIDVVKVVVGLVTDDEDLVREGAAGLGKKAVEKIAELAGKAVGRAGGTKVGIVIGTLVGGPAGAAIGAVIGGVIGGAVGGWVASWGAGNLYDSILDGWHMQPYKRFGKFVEWSE